MWLDKRSTRLRLSILVLMGLFLLALALPTVAFAKGDDIAWGGGDWGGGLEGRPDDFEKANPSWLSLFLVAMSFIWSLLP